MKHISPWWLLALILSWPAAEVGLLLHHARPGLERTAWALDYLMDCHANRACLPSQTLATVGSIKAAAAQSYQASRSMQATAVETLAFMKQFRSDVHGTLGEAQAGLHQGTLLVQELRTHLDTITTGTNALLTQATKTLQPLESTLADIDRLTQTLDKQITNGSPAVWQTVADLDAATKHLDVLLADPAIQTTLAHVSSASGHLDESAASVDTALRPWREKASVLKMIIGKALSLLKVTLPLPI